MIGKMQPYCVYLQVQDETQKSTEGQKYTAIGTGRTRLGQQPLLQMRYRYILRSIVGRIPPVLGV